MAYPKPFPLISPLKPPLHPTSPDCRDEAMAGIPSQTMKATTLLMSCVAAHPLMEGMEQLDTIISFKNGSTGIACELQRTATRSQNSRSERNLLSAFRDMSS
ncbi:hypothetical protein EDB84DRAFT_1573325 [Lactarius hengduanensis]|nr:hypothetical protein EDB84DRAFT_1573325 [Lactarius hengduanensis]